MINMLLWIFAFSIVLVIIRGIILIGIFDRALDIIDVQEDYYDLYKKFDRESGKFLFLIDLRKWTFKQFYPELDKIWKENRKELNKMDNKYVKKQIINIVNEKQGCKITELILEIISGFCECDVCRERSDKIDIPDLVTELINEGLLVEVEYVLPQMEYRIKSFILPAKTEVKINSK